MKVILGLKIIYGKLLSLKEKLFNGIFGNRKYKKFVIISDARTGSTLLMTLMNRHPEIIAKGELFKQLQNRTTLEIWNNIYCKRPKKIKWVGFKLFYDHPWHSNEKKVWEIIEDDKNIVIIHLVRNNKLRSYVSKQIGLKTKLWTEKVTKPNLLTIKDRQVRIDLKNCLSNIEEINYLESQARSRFVNHKIIPVFYEELDNDKNKTMNRIFRELNVSEQEINITMKKQNPETLQDLVLNYNELKTELSYTKWNYCLDEENSHIKG